jgi:hypothetical protein
MNAAWHFVKHRHGQPIVNPLGSEHFADPDDDWRPGEALVRECIQNSLDARHDDEVSVTFKVGGPSSMSAEMANYWFSSVWPHLQSKDCKLMNIEATPPPGGFVVVEDFGTHGLVGDVRQGGLSDADNRFFNFFRAEGLSGNPMNGTSGGSWGVGKSVFNRCSRINTFLALTGRRNERDGALLGKSLLWHHRIAAGEFLALGQFGSKDPSNECMVLPGTDNAIIRRFMKDFGLARPMDGATLEPGLSVVIPYADPEITVDGIVEIVIREYFHPIIAGRLLVRVSGMIAGRQSSIDINQDNLLEQAERRKRPEVTHVLKLARWSISEGPKEAYVLNEPPLGAQPAWHDALLRTDTPEFGYLCRRFDRGEPVAIRVPLFVKSSGKRADRAAFTVYLQRDLSGSGYRPVFVRGCIVVPNARRRAVRNQNLFSLVTIDEGPLAVMLRAAEPPAHTFWSPDTANFRGRYEHGKQTIDFVVGAPKYLADALSDARTERDLDVWADYFPSPVADGDRDAEDNRRKGTKRPPRPIEPPRTRLKPFRIDKVVGGFVVVRDHIAATPLPAALEVVAAYDASRGNPFKKYHSADFKFPKLKRVVRGIDEGDCSDNRLIFRPTSDEFRLEVTGFDGNRDLVVKVRTIGTATGGES